MHEQYLIDKGLTRRNFGRAAADYDKIASLQAETGRRLVERLDFIRIQPDTIIDLGSGTGKMGHALRQRYGHACTVSLDIAEPMLQQIPDRRRMRPPFRRNRAFATCGDIEALPFADQSCDLLISNLALQWCQNLDLAFTECLRVLRPKGLFLFTTCGPDTLRELRTAWRAVDTSPHINVFMDMHDIGDGLLRAGFLDPVMDREDMTLTYRDMKHMMHEIKQLGASNTNIGRNKGLTGKGHFRKLHAAYEQFRMRDGLLPLNYEIVYGHCWKGEHPPARDIQGETRVPLTALRRSPKKSGSGVTER